MASVTQYRVVTPPSPETIENLATRLANYWNISTEDGHYASQDPTTRDKATAAMYEQPRFLNTLSAYAVQLQPGGNPDGYLALVDAEIAKISSKDVLTVEDRVYRQHCAISAQHVFNEFKVHLAYSLHQEAWMRIVNRVDTLHREWCDAHLPASGSPRTPATPNPSATSEASISEPRTGRPATTMTVTADTQASSHPRTPPRPLDEATTERFLRAPIDMLNVKFWYSTEEEGDLTWTLASAAFRAEGMEYAIRFDDMPDEIPMDEDAMRRMLQESALLAA